MPEIPSDKGECILPARVFHPLNPKIKIWIPQNSDNNGPRYFRI